MSTRKVTAIRGERVTLQTAVDAFLSAPRCENHNTRRAYATVIDRLIAQLDPARELADVSDSDIGHALQGHISTLHPLLAATWGVPVLKSRLQVFCVAGGHKSRLSSGGPAGALRASARTRGRARGVTIVALRIPSRTLP
jgi:hypothetical protein